MPTNLDTSNKKALLRTLATIIASRLVIDGVQRVPREIFVPTDSRHMAYLDIALPIGEQAFSED